MKRRALALALSALSLVGGHFVNRRWDRAVLFFLAFVLWGIGVYASLTFRMNQGIDAAEDFIGLFRRHAGAFGAGGLLLWVASLVVTLIDSRPAAEGTVARWTGSGVAAAIGLSVTGLCALALAAMLSTARFGSEEPPDRTAGASERVRHPPRYFSHYVYLGRADPSRAELPAPPTGDGYLRGRFVYEGEPAAGVTLSLALNGKYETDRLTTDGNGEFTVRLPHGEWVVNRLATHEWRGQPEDGSFLIVTGQEPKLVGDGYNEHYWIDREGMRIAVGGPPKEPQMTFAIRKRVEVTWPGPGREAARTAVGEGVVTWEAYPGAEAYLVRIMELERKGTSTTYREVATTKVSGDTHFPLARLLSVPNEEGEKEYQVSVVAFAKDGTLLSESNDRLDGHLFMLTDARQFVLEADRLPGADRFSEEELEQAYDNNRRLEAATVLLKDGLVDEAGRLLGKVKGKTDPGKQAAVTGFLMAKRRRCGEAKRLFAQAQMEGGRTCVPNYYRAGCGE